MEDSSKEYIYSSDDDYDKFGEFLREAYDNSDIAKGFFDRSRYETSGERAIPTTARQAVANSFRYGSLLVPKIGRMQYYVGGATNDWFPRFSNADSMILNGLGTALGYTYNNSISDYNLDSDSTSYKIGNSLPFFSQAKGMSSLQRMVDLGLAARATATAEAGRSAFLRNKAVTEGLKAVPFLMLPTLAGLVHPYGPDTTEPSAMDNLVTIINGAPDEAKSFADEYINEAKNIDDAQAEEEPKYGWLPEEYQQMLENTIED